MYYQEQQQGEWTEDGAYIPNPERLYTLEEYWGIVKDAREGYRYEYINGHIRLMSGASNPHEQLVINIGALLHNALAEEDCYIYGSNAKVALENGQRIYQPDVSVSCDSFDRMRPQTIQAVSVVVEILSPRTEKIDRIEKLPAYQAHPTIHEILLVSSRRRQVEHYHRVASVGRDDLWELHTCTRDEDVIDLASVGVRFSLREVYRKVYLELEEEEELAEAAE